METDHVQKTSPCCLCYHFTWKVGLTRLSILFHSESWALTICVFHTAVQYIVTLRWSSIVSRLISRRSRYNKIWMR
uniref:Uncharacterized protein n=1 Tax=Populus trichocarpa TaxID=3694 RepID=A0A2K2C7J9_POPTR